MISYKGTIRLVELFRVGFTYDWINCVKMVKGKAYSERHKVLCCPMGSLKLSAESIEGFSEKDFEKFIAVYEKKRVRKNEKLTAISRLRKRQKK